MTARPVHEGSRKLGEPKQCCPGLGHLIAHAGEAGLSALAWDNGVAIVLRLQARGIGYDHEHLVADDPSARDRIWRVSTSTGLTYCPFCGSEVARLVRSAPRYFESLAKMHYRFADENPDRPVIRGRRGT